MCKSGTSLEIGLRFGLNSDSKDIPLLEGWGVGRMSFQTR